MQNSTILYQLKKMLGLNRLGKTEKLIAEGLSDSFEPSQKTLKNIMAFSNAYKFEKSKAIGEIEYLIN